MWEYAITNPGLFAILALFLGTLLLMAVGFGLAELGGFIKERVSMRDAKKEMPLKLQEANNRGLALRIRLNEQQIGIPREQLTPLPELDHTSTEQAEEDSTT